MRATTLMTERRPRKGVSTPETLHHAADWLTERAERLHAIADGMSAASIDAVDIHGYSKLDRGQQLLDQFIARLEFSVREKQITG